MGYALRKVIEDPPVTVPVPKRSKPPVRVAQKKEERDPVREFLLEMVETAGGSSLQLRFVVRSYEQLRIERGWPAMSVKKLSQELIRVGCVRSQLDKRYRPVEVRRRLYAGLERPTVFVFPSEVA